MQDDQTIKSPAYVPVGQVPFHTHNGSDSIAVQFSDIAQKTGYAVCTVQGLAGATASNYGVFFTFPFAGAVVAVTEVHGTKGTDGSAVTLQVEKLTGTTASGAGTALLSTALSLKTNNNTVQSGALTQTKSILQFAIGNRLGLTTSGTLTAVANVTVVVTVLY